MFRYLLLKALDAQDYLDRMKEENREDYAERVYDDSPAVGNLDRLDREVNRQFARFADWFGNTAVAKAEKLKQEKNRQYRQELRELLGG